MSSTEFLDWEELDFPTRVLLKQKSEKSFMNFSRIWFELLQGDRMLVNWHHKWIAWELDQIVRGKAENGNVVFNIPPGGTKTELISIHLPAYVNMLTQIGVLDRFRNMNLSYSNTLVERNSRRTRDIIKSKEYQELWPCEFGVNKAEEWDVVDDKGKVKGQTTSRATGGQITGGRGGFYGPKFSGAVVQDDPDKPEDMFSQTKREAAHRRQTNTIRSRRGDKSKEHPTPFWLVQQRLHTEDTSAFLLSGGMGVQFRCVSIPALIDEKYIESLPEQWQEECRKSIKGTDSRVIDGVEYWSYWPKMEHVDQLIDLKERDEYTFWSQYMQKPAKQSGGLLDVDWFGEYTQLPFLEWTGIYVDTNSGKVNDRNDYTVFLICGMGDDGNLYVLDRERGKWDPEELLVKADELWAKWRNYPKEQRLFCRYMSIEDKQAGQGLIQTLKKERKDKSGNKIPAITVKPVERGTDQNKVIRHHNVQPQIKNGKVFLPKIYDETGNRIRNTTWFNGDEAFSTDWVTEFAQECSLLTYEVLLDKEKGYDDQYDTLMDAIQDMLMGAGVSSTGLSFITRRR